MTDDKPGVLVFPPLLLGGAVLLGLVLEGIAPLGLGWGWGLRMVGIVLIAVAGALPIWAARHFRRSGTNVHPGRPTRAIVAAGPYRFTRNPMYVGFAGLQAGLGLALAAPWLLLLLVPVILVLDRGVIAREERYLERKFGITYTDYRKGVRRWL